MICGECFKELENSFKFRLRARRSETAYFQSCRVEHKRKVSEETGSIEDGSAGKSDGKTEKNYQKSKKNVENSKNNEGKSKKSDGKSEKNDGRSSSEEQSAFVSAFAKEIAKGKANFMENPSNEIADSSNDLNTIEPPIKKKKTVTFANPEVKEVRLFEKVSSGESTVQPPVAVGTKMVTRRAQTARKRSAYRCLQCSRTFASAASLQSHILEFHPKGK